MKKRSFLLLASLMLVLSVFLAACSGNDNASGDGKNKGKDKGTDNGTTEKGDDDNKAELDFPLAVSNDKEAMEDGEMTVALVADEPFEGTLSTVFYSVQYDAEILAYFDEALLDVDGDYLITNEGAATYELSEDNKTLKLKIKDNVNWSDGEPVKTSDLLYSYQLLGHPDYVGDRYGFMIENIEGMPAYHEGKTKEISGIKIIDEKNMEFKFTEATPSILSGFWSNATPRHHVGDVMTGEVTMKDLESSDKIRVNPIGFGPYKVDKIVPGESILFSRNDDYWRGKPALKSIVQKVVSSATIVESMKNGDVDLATIPADQYLTVKDVDTLELLAKVDLSYTYIGFKQGKWDAKKKENITDPNAKMASKELRQAMWYAMDNATIGEKLYHGLRFPGTTLIIPVFESFHNKEIEGRPYDPEKAKELLEEAGFKDTDGDGIREDQNGEKLVINFASMSGGETAEPIAKAYMQNWADVGLKVELVDGRLHDINAFYDMVENDDPKIDIYQGAWGTGSDPDPSGTYGRTDSFNMTRWTSEKNDELLKQGTSEKAFDLEYRKKIYDEWQEYMFEEVPAIPTVYRYKLKGVNKRVVNYDIEPASETRLYKVGVSE